LWKLCRHLALRTSQTIAVQVGAMRIEPGLRLLMARDEAVQYAPKPLRVIHFNKVRHFMGGEVFEDMAWRQNEPP
jgi:hypothetical protein